MPNRLVVVMNNALGDDEEVPYEGDSLDMVRPAIIKEMTLDRCLQIPPGQCTYLYVGQVTQTMLQIIFNKVGEKYQGSNGKPRILVMQMGQLTALWSAQENLRGIIEVRTANGDFTSFKVVQSGTEEEGANPW